MGYALVHEGRDYGLVFDGDRWVCEVVDLLDQEVAPARRPLDFKFLGFLSLDQPLIEVSIIKCDIFRLRTRLFVRHELNFILRFPDNALDLGDELSRHKRILLLPR